MLAWGSDLHLDHARPATVAAFLDRVRAAAPSVLMLGGDVSNAGQLPGHLRALTDAAAPAPVRLVLGNHDFYGASLAAVRFQVGGLAAAEDHRLTVLDGAVPMDLGAGAWLVGAGGWGDGRAGGAARRVALNDEAAIAELAEAEGRGELGMLLARLGTEAAAALARSLEQVPARARRVVVLAHVPPFAGAAWHRGRPSEPAFQQRFCWAAGGDVLAAFSASRAGVEVVVLCGHTHGGGFLRVVPNLAVVTAPADYGAPRLICFAPDAPVEEIARAAGAWLGAGMSWPPPVLP